MSVNKVILVGNVGKDPEVRHLEGGATVARFSLATNETYTDKSGKKVTQTEWHNIVVWRGLAEIAEKYVKSGKLLYVEGRIRNSSYEDKEGNKRYTTEILCDNFRFLGPSTGQGEKPNNYNESHGTDVGAAESDAEIPQPDDDLPF
ncbi:MAG: single-stranded DNA-binding protein [Tenuifilum sp.]|jgi:single-strand DNA-binding protein|uniref:single-stranded DNA-binding protein n=2 Tax=Tenuifilum sp. TaxID=2760880 RepID=UPI001B7B8478|nr:single-stranded DNA-binding protein [Bacteroidales bacterium]HOK60916.1 single-stranded DNA-binding protein [Tenuifilum sp.]MBP9029075.1 single-stranded DNA-binding protein [Bacteroidales bacterium]HOK87040.1 single-stranded DNA-binding protein [Tenuifilum sp.]HPP90504.1 single-stranded DNA-binding protein [Tenuifilum sp.]